MALTGDFSSPVLIRAAIVTLVAGYVVNFLWKLYQARAKVKDLPKPPHSFWLGNIPVMAKIYSEFPDRTHPHTVIPYVQKKYNLPSVFYLDSWPLGDQVCVVLDPDVASQVTLQPSLPKHKALEKIVLPLTGRNSLLTIEGAHHKKWRNIFNPGFSNSHLMTLVDGIVNDGLVFLDILGEYTETGEVLLMEEAATRFTVDVIGRVVLDAPMNAQRSANEFVNAFRSTMSWFLKQPEYNVFNYFNPLRPIIQELNRKKMDRFLEKVMDERFAAKSRKQRESKVTANKRQPKPIIDLALDTYTKESGVMPSNDGKVDRSFKAEAINHIKLFMFAGHDTTSSTICYAVYELSRYPEALTKLLAECENVFGPDVTQTASRIKEDPYLINQLPYTIAVVKETLRLWAPASTLREGSPGYFLHHDDQKWPTEDFVIWPGIYGLQRDPKLWPFAERFIPERWLAEEGDLLYPPKGAWRPFELGPRSCIGSELALIESRIILVLILRQFSFKPVYDELDSDPKMATQGIKTTPDGERAYQVMIATAKPAGGMPVRVRRR